MKTSLGNGTKRALKRVNKSIGQNNVQIHPIVVLNGYSTTLPENVSSITFGVTASNLYTHTTSPFVILKG